MSLDNLSLGDIECTVSEQPISNTKEPAKLEKAQNIYKSSSRGQAAAKKHCEFNMISLQELTF